MKKLKWILAVVTVSALVMFPRCLWAVNEHGEHEHAGHEHADHEHTDANSHMHMEAASPTAGSTDLGIAPTQGADGVIELNNKVCPVSGKEVSGKHFYEHDGVRYSLCCKMCANDFAKYPEKFSVSMETIHQAMGHTGQTH